MTLTIQINDASQQRVRTFPLDTDTTIFNRIVWVVKSLPEYVRWDRETDAVVDVWDMARQGETLDNLLELPDFDPVTIYSLWALYHPDSSVEARRRLERHIGDWGLENQPKLLALASLIWGSTTWLNAEG